MSEDADEEAERPSAASVREPDRLLDFPHPRATIRLFGHDRAEREMLDAWRSRRMHHAWLLAGPEGIGKATLTYRFARFVLAQGSRRTAASASDLSVPDNHPAAKLIAAQAHPNFMQLRRAWNETTKRFGQNIGVDDVRRLRAFFATTGAMPGYRAVVIDRADDLNASGANALLKTLEEPPGDSLFLLVCTALGRLPPTIRSRCRLLKLEPLDGASLANAVRQALGAIETGEPSTGDLTLALELAEGSVRRALSLLRGDSLAVYRRLIALLETLPSLDMRGVHALADKAGSFGNAEGFEAIFELLLGILARLVRAGARGEQGTETEMQLAARLVGPDGLAPWAELWETSVLAKVETLALNLDRKLLILETFFRIQDLARAKAA